MGKLNEKYSEIKFRPWKSEKAYSIPMHYTPRVLNFKSGVFIIGGQEFTEATDEFWVQVKRVKMWEALGG